jgi:hypothetical protein
MEEKGHRGEEYFSAAITRKLKWGLSLSFVEVGP